MQRGEIYRLSSRTLSLSVSSETVDGKLFKGISINVVIPPVKAYKILSSFHNKYADELLKAISWLIVEMHMLNWQIEYTYESSMQKIKEYNFHQGNQNVELVEAKGKDHDLCM